MRPGADPARVEKYPFSAVASEIVALTPEQVADTLTPAKMSTLPSWHATHNQGFIEGSCVGHAVVMERAISNIAQNRLLNVRPFVRRYDPITVWRLAKARDEWAETNPDDDDGTSANAAYSVLRELGPRRIDKMGMGADGRPRARRYRSEHDPSQGVEQYRWALTVDEMRYAFAAGIPAIAIGTPWMSGFDHLDARPGRFGRLEYFLPGPSGVGRLRGYHETCLYGASDEKQAFAMKNSWGKDWPLAWLPYETMEWCFGDWADAALPVDR